MKDPRFKRTIRKDFCLNAIEDEKVLNIMRYHGDNFVNTIVRCINVYHDILFPNGVNLDLVDDTTSGIIYDDDDDFCDVYYEEDDGILD